MTDGEGEAHERDGTDEAARRAAEKQARRDEKQARKERKARRRARWRIEHRLGSPAFLHGLALPDPLRRSVWVMGATSAAVALGSAQRPETVDRARAEAAGLDIVRRHSGGGAVLLQPGDMRWLDVLLPADDPYWDDDVGRSFLWLGEVWVEALASVGIVGEVHTGAPVRGEWSSLVCFAGLGTGEVTIAGRKAVGFSQRRTRSGARFQCMVHADWDPAPLLEVLALGPDERGRAAVALDEIATGVGRDRLGPLVAAALTTIEGRRAPTHG